MNSPGKLVKYPPPLDNFFQTKMLHYGLVITWGLVQVNKHQIWNNQLTKL